MKKLLVGIFAVALLGAVLTGCKQGNNGSGGGGDAKAAAGPAISIKDGAKKYDKYQGNCPVCGKGPISPDYYADTDNGRIYFDREQCMKKFKEDPQKYLEEYVPTAEKSRNYMKQGG